MVCCCYFCCSYRLMRDGCYCRCCSCRFCLSLTLSTRDGWTTSFVGGRTPSWSVRGVCY